MTITKLNLSKEHPDLPDSYCVQIDYINGKSETLEVVKHIIVDKIFLPVPGGKKIGWEPHQAPYVEFQLSDDTYKTVPLANASFHYDKNWTKIVEIRNQLKEKADEIKKLAS